MDRLIDKASSHRKANGRKGERGSMADYSRSNPSPRYRELIGMYRDMHEHGIPEQNLPASETFDGRSLKSHARIIKSIIDIMGSQTILDYGAGKGTQYRPEKIATQDGDFPDIKSFWGVDAITCYDPGNAEFDTLPDGRFDGVISTDMLEHCPSEDLPWVIDEIFSFADEFLYLNVACYPALKVLPDGENAHVTIEPPDWWLNRFDAAVTAHPGLRYFTCFDVLEKGPDGKDNLTRLMGKGKSKPKHPGG